MMTFEKTDKVINSLLAKQKKEMEEVFVEILEDVIEQVKKLKEWRQLKK